MSVIDAVMQASRLSSRVRVRVETQTHIWAVKARKESNMSTETDTTVQAELRENFGKGYARRLRAAGKIPAVIYGHGTEPVHVALPGHQIGLLVRRANVVLELKLDGKTQLTLIKDVQKDPVHQIIEHIDLLVVKKGEKVHVDVPVTVMGESFAGTIVNFDHTTVSLEVEATHIPTHVEVDVEGLEEGVQITAGELKLPKGAALLTAPEALIVAITVPAAPTADDVAAEAEAGDAGEAAEEAPAEEAAE